jgi:lycopene beta-cyclase
MGTYDIIIAGAGAAGLLLADALGSDPYFRGQSILILDKDLAKANDRTWCFWETGKGDFDHILHARWDELHFGGKQYRATFPIAPYHYKMIRAADFYREYRQRIANYPNIEYKEGHIIRIWEENNTVRLQTEGTTYTAGKVFNSILKWEELLSTARVPVLQQHFLGWFVTTAKPVFNPKAPTFMDFSVPQKGNTRFMYVLPLTDNQALVEYTLFSEKLLETAEYEAAISDYLENHLGCKEYQITEKEMGRIPMTCFDFRAANTNRLIHIGAAGGWAKPSTGYTFLNSSRKVRELLTHLKTNKPLNAFGGKNRFWWYDLLLLDILSKNNEKGSEIFEKLFSQRETSLILKFLDEQTTFWEDLQVIRACPKKPFLKALLHRLLT